MPTSKRSKPGKKPTPEFRLNGATPGDADLTAALLRIRGLERSVTEQKKQTERWILKFEEAEERLDVALQIREHTQVRVLVARKGRPGDSVAVAVASDWHVEETVDPTTINGRNTYNLAVADARIAACFQNTLRLVEIQRHGTNIDTLVLGLLGDLMTGYIHEELIEGNSLSPTQTILWVMPRVMAGIRLLAPHFSRVLVPCCPGNHGRTTLKPRVATAYKNSYEWLMYHVLAQQCAADPKLRHVAFSVVNSYHNWVSIAGHEVRFHHGEAIRYQGGVGGLTIPVRKAIANWNRERTAALDVFGHWHQLFDGGDFVSNGSLIGYNAFAVTIKAPYEPPRQTFFLMHSDHGKTINAPVWV